jgi:hypothetical protein
VRIVAIDAAKERGIGGGFMAIFLEEDLREGLAAAREARESSLLQIYVSIQEPGVVHLRDVMVIGVVPKHRDDRHTPLFGELLRESDRLKTFPNRIERSTSEARLLASDDGASSRLRERTERVKDSDWWRDRSDRFFKAPG